MTKISILAHMSEISQLGLRLAFESIKDNASMNINMLGPWLVRNNQDGNIMTVLFILGGLC